MAMRSPGLLGFYGLVIFSYALLGNAAPPERAAARAFVNTPANNVTLVPRAGGFARFIGTDPGRPLPNTTLMRRADDRARAFLDSNRDLFVSPSTALELSTTSVSENDDVGISHVRVQQRINGIAVYGAEAVVHLTDTGVTAVSSNLVSPPIDLSTVPTIASDTALATAQVIVIKKYGPVAAQFSVPELQIFDIGLLQGDLGQPVLAWFIEASGDAVRERIWINAHTGDVALNFSQLTDARNRRTFNANNTTTIPTTPARTETQAATGNADVDTAHDFAGDFYNYFFSEHARDSFDGLGRTIDSVVRFCDSNTNCPMRNAFWNGIRIALGAGYALDDVVGHELTHAVVQYTSDLDYINEPGALNESYADIFGETIDLGNGKGNDAANVRWLIGEDLPGATLGTGIRDMMNPASFNDPERVNDPLYYCLAGDNGGVHINSGVPNHAYALMVDGGTFNGYTVAGIGITKAAKIQYRALARYLTFTSKFIDNYNALIQSCTDLTGTSGITIDDCAQVKLALLAVEMNVLPCPVVTFNVAGALTTTESRGTASYSVALTRAPTANVTLNMASDNPGEGAVAPASITFTTTNWNVARAITLTGVDDTILDGDVPYRITTSTSSADSRFNTATVPPVSATNRDNDVAGGIAVTPTSGLATTEAGGTASYSVVLTSQPTANVTLNMQSDDLGEGTVVPASITFTSANWNIARTITLTGVDDNVIDGNIPYRVTASINSVDVRYGALTVPPVSATNLDNDVAGIAVAPTSGMATTEAGGTASFNVVLTSQPTANVTLNMQSDNLGEGTVAPASIIFTAANWSVARAMTVSGVDDKIMDGNVLYHVTTAISSADVNYSVLTVPPVNVTNLDNDIAGITVTPTSGLTTTEAGGTASFTISIDSQPRLNVVIGLTSSKVSEGTIAPTSLTFSDANWNISQTVTVTGVDDAVADGNVAYTIITAAAVSADPNYSGRNAADVSVTNSDNDQANILISGATGLVTSESGASATFTLVLTTAPTDTVTVAVRSSNTNEGTVDRSQVTFTSATWNQPQLVTVTGVDDASLDGDIAFTIFTDAAISNDVKYSGINIADVQALNRDNDPARIDITAAANLQTTESRAAAQFALVLSQQPSATVTVALASSNSNEGTVAPRSVVFTKDNWSMPQTVTITGVDDAVIDGDVRYKISIDPSTSLDNSFRVLAVQTLDVINRDNEAPPAAQSDTADGLVISASADLATTESGGTASFTITLARQPTASVSITLLSSNSHEGVVKPASLRFSAANWSSPQTVSVTGVDDKNKDGNVTYQVQISAPSSNDKSFASTPAHEVMVVNMDNEQKVSTGAFGPLFLFGLYGIRRTLRRAAARGTCCTRR